MSASSVSNYTTALDPQLLVRLHTAQTAATQGAAAQTGAPHAGPPPARLPIIPPAASGAADNTASQQLSAMRLHLLLLEPVAGPGIMPTSTPAPSTGPVVPRTLLTV